ncbi:MAG: hypothetical protein KH268_13260 [Clostridiales bacterium]|nr:hypothetical protein [Clostridiales bacterium]
MSLDTQRFEEAFYTNKEANPDNLGLNPSAENADQNDGEGTDKPVEADAANKTTESDQELLLKLLAKPELAALLKSLANTLS